MAKNGFERLFIKMTVIGLMLLFIAALQIYGDDGSIWTDLAEPIPVLKDVCLLSGVWCFES